jgi:hypothetical protein
MNLASQISQWRRLAEGFASTEGDALQQRIIQNSPQYIIRIFHMTSVKIMGLGIVAANAVVGTPLGEDGKTVPFTVYN